MLENTFTYTARSLENPENVVTFTLHDHSMSVDMSVPIENLERALQSAAEAEQKMIPISQLPWLRPVSASLIQWGTHPFRVADIEASLEGYRLGVLAWIRLGGLRLAPIPLPIEPVDNPEAAEAFVKELSARKDTAESPGRFQGPLDYWAGWLLSALLIIIPTLIWLRGKDKEGRA